MGVVKLVSVNQLLESATAGPPGPPPGADDTILWDDGQDILWDDASTIAWDS